MAYFPGMGFPGQTPPFYSGGGPLAGPMPPMASGGGGPGGPLTGPQPQAPAGAGRGPAWMQNLGGRLQNAMTSPMFHAGMGLLAAGQDSRINAPQAAMGGIMNANQMQHQQQQQEMQQQQLALQQQEQERRQQQAEIARQQFEQQQVEQQRLAQGRESVKGLLESEEFADLPKGVRSTLGLLADLNPEQALAALQTLAGPQPTGSDFTLSPGQARFSGSGDQIAALPGEQGAADQRQQKIQAAYQGLLARGLPEGEQTMLRAAETVDGHRAMRFDPVSGTVVQVDELSGSAAEVPRQNNQTEIPAPAPGRTLWDLASEATGPVSAGAAGGSRVTGALGGPVASETIVSRQRFRLATQGLLTSLREGGSRPLAAELEQIFKAMDLEPKIIDNPEAMRARLRAIDEDLKVRVAQSKRTAADTSLPRETRNAAAAAANALDNFLVQVGVPPGPETLPGWDELSPEEQAELRELMQ